MPQVKLDSKLLNRVFAAIFALYALICTYYVTVWDFGSAGREMSYALFMTPFLIIFVGLLVEAWKPSLDFTFHRDRKWIFISVILLVVFVLLQVYWWTFQGFVHWLPDRGLQAAFAEYFSKVFACDTSILSLMFGILFLTNSIPQKSLSYKIMLIGTVIIELQLFIGHITFVITGGTPGSQNYGNYWGFTIFQPWYWMDIISQIAVFIGATWLLIRANLKKLIFIICLIWFLLLSPLIFFAINTFLK